MAEQGDENQPNLAGGWSAEKPADPEVQVLCETVKAEFLKQSGVNTKKYVAVTYRSQVVAGRNFLVKVCLDKDHFCHLKIYEPLPYTGENPTLTKFECNKTKDEPIESF